MRTKFSIIVPVYNSEKYFEECILSLINQNYENFEIIIVDDGSTDNTNTIYKKYSSNKNVKVVVQQNGGVAKARYEGIKIATGDYVLFCDSDDTLYYNTLYLISDIIDKYNPDIIDFRMTFNNNFINCNKGKYYDRIAIEKLLFSYLLEDKFGRYFAPQICCSAFKKNIYEKAQAYKDKIVLGEDLASKKAALYNANSIYIMEDVLYFYRRNDNSATLSKKAFPWDGPKLIGKHIENKMNINMFDFREQLNRLITHQLFIVVLSQFNTNKKYKEIKNNVMQIINDDYYYDAIKNCKYSFLYFKGNIARILLKYKLIFIMYLISKIY